MTNTWTCDRCKKQGAPISAIHYHGKSFELCTDCMNDLTTLLDKYMEDKDTKINLDTPFGTLSLTNHPLFQQKVYKDAIENEVIERYRTLILAILEAKGTK